MNKNLIAVLAATTMTASIATVDITGTYEGVLTDGNPGAAAYGQDLDLKMVGTAGDSTVTVLMENLTGNSAVTASQVFIESGIEGITFKGGSYKNQNGSGLLQAESAITNQFEVGTHIAGVSVSAGQVSESSNTTVDAGFGIAGLGVNVQNATATDRFISVVTNFFGFGITAETQNTTVGRNLAVALDTSIALNESSSIALTTVYMDVKDTAGVTQDDGILGDVSDAATGSTVKGAVASLNTSIGDVSGKFITKNDVNTYVGELTRGVWTFGHSKTENTDGVTTAKINVAF